MSVEGAPSAEVPSPAGDPVRVDPPATTDAPSRTGHLPRRERYLRRYRLLVGALLLGALFVYLAGNNLYPLVDRDEPRYAQTSREMLHSGNWTLPTFLGEPRLKKPPLIYWLQASAMRVVGDTAFAARLPSVLASVATLGLLAIALPRMVGHRRAIWAAFVFATALMPAYLAKVCMTDAVLHLFIAASLICLYAVWRGTARWPTYALLGLSIGLALLTKGPAVVMFLGMTLLALWALNQTIDDAPPGKQITLDAERAVPFVFMRVMVVLGIALLVCLPWVLAFERTVPGGLMAMFSKEIVARGTDPQEGHSGPPGFYAVTFWGTYFPWCLLWPAAIVHGWKRRRLPWVRYCLAAVLGPWLFLEIYRTKLPHYWLPSYPYMAILTADVLIRGLRARIADFRERGFDIGTMVFAGFCAAMGVAILVLPWIGDRPTVLGYLSAIVLAGGFGLLGWGTMTLLKRRELLPAAFVMGLGTAALLVFTTTLYWPNTPSLTLAKRVGLTLNALGTKSVSDVQMIGFKEASVAFYQGGTAREQSDSNFLHAPTTQPWPRYLVVDENQLKKVMTPTDQARWPVVQSFAGMNVAKGLKKERVYILQNHMPPTTSPVAR